MIRYGSQDMRKEQVKCHGQIFDRAVQVQAQQGTY